MHNSYVRDTRDAGKFGDAVAEIEVFEIQKVRRVESTRSIKCSSANEHEAAAGNLYIA